MDKVDSFVFYRSFLDTTEYFDGGERGEFLYFVCKCLLGDMDPHDVPFPYGAAIIQMQASVKAARERHEKTVGAGVTGGRAPIVVPPEQWQPYRDQHTQAETAEHFGISIDTLQRWEKKTGYKKDRKTAKPQNLNINDNVNVNVNANVNDNNINSIYKNNKGESDASALSGIVLPKLKEGERWIGEPYELDEGRWVCEFKTADGEERTMIIREPK